MLRRLQTNIESELENKELELLEQGYKAVDFTPAKPGQYRKEIDHDQFNARMIYMLEWQESEQY
jgi:hypothetical protein